MEVSWQNQSEMEVNLLILLLVGVRSSKGAVCAIYLSLCFPSILKMSDLDYAEGDEILLKFEELAFRSRRGKNDTSRNILEKNKPFFEVGFLRRMLRVGAKGR